MDSKAKKTAYQHFVPQFILRKFSDFARPTAHTDPIITGTQLKRAKAAAKVNQLTLRHDDQPATIQVVKANKTFGQQDMYRDIDPDVVDANAIEQKLSKLEQQASKVISCIEADISAGSQSIQISRKDKDILRRFLFIMLYRNQNIHSRFSKTTEEYNAVDRRKMLNYMRNSNFATPKAVWLASISAFLDISLGFDSNRWEEELKKQAYPGDAEWMIHQLNNFYLSFCVPTDPEDEFILTENSYGVYEGPNSFNGWHEWHTFAPISPRLIFVMRSQWLDQLPSHLKLDQKLYDNLEAERKSLYETLLASYEDPVEAQSWLQDLPVNRPETSYPALRFVADKGTQCDSGLSNNDAFTFKFSRVDSAHVQRINSIFLEEAINTQGFIFKSNTGLRRALEAYLLVEKVGFKVVHQRSKPEESVLVRIGAQGPVLVTGKSDEPEYQREEYLKTLESIAAQLGSSKMARYTVSSPRICSILPRLPNDFVRRYAILGKCLPRFKVNFLIPQFPDHNVAGSLDPRGLSDLLNDFDQANRITILVTYTDAAIRIGKDNAKSEMQRNRGTLINNLPARRVWIHCRQLRVIQRLGPDSYHSNNFNVVDLLRLVTADEAGGPEDALIDTFTGSHSSKFCELMTAVVASDLYSKQEKPFTFCHHHRE